MNDASIEPVTISIPAALRASGLGRTKLYELIAKREIASVRVGTRRLVNYASLKAFLNSTEA
jgi:excisionase family DNA binding protein